MRIAHLTASTFYGGPERQMLGLADALAASQVESVFLSFSEKGRCRSFLGRVRSAGFEAIALEHDTPWLRAATRDLTDHLARVHPDVLFCHGYKANLLGRIAARRCDIPAVSVSRGWTQENWKVRVYEALDRRHLRWMDRVVAVSEGQAEKVRRCAVPAERMRVIHNAVDPERFTDPDPTYREKLARFFRQPFTRIVGAAGRLSPEKGFDVLIAAAARVVDADDTVGFLLFGEGPCKAELVKQINAAGLSRFFVMSGFRADLDRFIPFLDLLVLPSYTEGLPNVVLEAFASSVPVVATAVGGTPELVEDKVSGYLVPPGDADALAGRILDALSSEDNLREMGLRGRQRVLEHFTFERQAERYLELLGELTAGQTAAVATTGARSLPMEQRAETTATETEAPCQV
jgi:glycosyltransferase involved in cell wall biosynthesis